MFIVTPEVAPVTQVTQADQQYEVTPLNNQRSSV